MPVGFPFFKLTSPPEIFVFDVIFAYVSEENKGVVALLRGLFHMSQQEDSDLSGKVLDITPNAMIDHYKGVEKRIIELVKGD